MFRSVEARGYERFESYRVSSIEKLLLSKGNGRGRNSSTCLFIPGDPGIKYLHRAVVERGPWKVGRRSHVRGEVSSLHTRGWIATTRRSNDLQRPCKSYSLSGAAEGRLGEKYCFWFSPGVSNEGSTANMCPWNSTLMNADVFNQGDWRDLAKRRSGIERAKYVGSTLPLLPVHETLWGTYWIVDTIRISSLSTVTPLRIVTSPLNSNRRGARRAIRDKRKTKGDRWDVLELSRDRPRSIKN